MDLNFERIRNNKLEILRDISVKTFIETFASQNKEENIKQYLDTKMSLANLNEELNNMDSRFYFIILNNTIIGYTKLNFESAQTEKIFIGNAFEVERIYLLSKHARKGYGRKAFENIFQIGKKKGYEKIWLGVWEYNKNAIEFYKHMGFKIFSKHSFLLGDDNQTDLLLKIDI